jgi:hypothetical protein
MNASKNLYLWGMKIEYLISKSATLFIEFTSTSPPGISGLPFSGSSMTLLLAHIVNDIIINERKCIIKFGAGISAIIMGCLKNKLFNTPISFDHSALPFIDDKLSGKSYNYLDDANSCNSGKNSFPQSNFLLSTNVSLCSCWRIIFYRAILYYH